MQPIAPTIRVQSADFDLQAEIDALTAAVRISARSSRFPVSAVVRRVRFQRLSSNIIPAWRKQK